MRKARLRRRTLLVVAVVVVAVAAVSSIVAFSWDSIFHRSGRTSSTSTTQAQPTSQPTATPQPKIVGKEIPPQYVMGNPVDIELKTGMGVLFIENSEQKVSLRFTAKLSGDATAVAVNGLASSENALVRVGLQRDASGRPDGRWIDDSAFGSGYLQRDKGFMTVNLQKVAALSQGAVYHVVVEPAEASFNESISIIVYKANYAAQPYNVDDPDILWPDTAINSLSYDGDAWHEEDEWPVFVVKYTDGRSEGQPYSLAAPWVIHDGVYVGQTVIPASTYRVGRIGFVVSLKGSPTDKLYYQVRDSGNNVLADGVFAEAARLTTWKSWVEVDLSSPVTLNAGQLYRIVLLSPGTNLDNAYRVYGHEFTYDVAVSYGGLQHQLVTSHDGGSRWAENRDADAIFKLTTV